MSIRTVLIADDQALPVKVGSDPDWQDARAQPGAPQPPGAGHTTASFGWDTTHGDADSLPRQLEKGESPLEVMDLKDTGSVEEDRPYSVFTKNEKWFIVVAIAFAGLLG